MLRNWLSPWDTIRPDPSLIKTVVPRAGVTPDGFTFTRTSTATDVVNGVLTSYASGAIRAANGYLPEEQRTNSLRNGNATGATVGTIGSGGALPTNWTQTNTIGLTVAVTGSGTDGNGFPYVDIRLSGTPTAGDWTLFFESNTQITAASGQAWAASGYFRVSGGSLNAITDSKIRIDGCNVGVSLENSSASFGLTGNYSRPSITRNLGNALTTRVVSSLVITCTANPVDVTLRVAACQLEQGALKTSYIPTTTAAATRNADTLSINVASIPGYSATAGTVVVRGVIPLDWANSLRTPCYFALNQSGTNYIGMNTRTTTGKMICDITTGGVSQAGVESWAVIPGSEFVAAMSWDASGCSISVMGGAVVTDASVTLPTPTALYIGSLGSGTSNRHANTYIKEVKLYNVRKSDAELVALSGGFAYSGQISDRSAVVNTNTTQTGLFTGNQVQQWSEIYFPTVCRNPIFTFANYRPDTTANNAQLLYDGYSDYTITCALEISGTIYPVYFDGVLSKTCPVGGTITGSTSDVTIPAATTGILRWFISHASSPTTWAGATPYNYNKFNEYGTALTDRTQAASWAGGAIVGGVYYQMSPPVACVGLKPNRVAVSIFGDSIGSGGSSDTYWGLGVGYIQRALDTAKVPWQNNGASGMRAGQFVSSSSDQVASRNKRLAALAASGVTHVISNWGANDLMAESSGAAIYSNLTATKAYLDAYGIKLICCTLCPRTNAANTAEPAAGVWTYRNDFNSLVVSNNGVGYGYFDAAAYSQDKNNKDIWRTDLTGGAPSDGAHPTAAIHDALATALGLALPSLLV